MRRYLRPRWTRPLFRTVHAGRQRRLAERACENLRLEPLAVRWFSDAYGRQIDARGMFLPELAGAVWVADDTPHFLAGAVVEHEARHAQQFAQLDPDDERL